MSTYQVPEVPSPTFEQLMILVSEVVRKAIMRHPNQQPADLSEVEDMVEGYLRDTQARGITFPPAMLVDFKQAMQVLKDAPRQLEAQRDRPGIDLTVRYLLSRNYEHLKDRVGATEASRIVSDFSRSLGRKPRGRPSKMPLVTLVKAKQLHDAGKSYTQIGIALKLTRQQVRCALRHHYPEKKPG